MDEEIHNLKKEISHLKASNVALDKRISKLEDYNIDPKHTFSIDIIEASTSNIKENFLGHIGFADDEILQKLELITS